MSHPTQPPAPLSVMAILVLALLSAVAPLATDMYLPAFPSIATELASNAAAIQMTLTSFLLGLAVGQLVIGPVSDRFGRRKPLLLGTALAIISGFLCAIAPNVETLVGLRALQGFGGAAGVVLARAIIADRTTDAIGAARLFQIMMVIGGLAPVLAPVIGTAIVHLAGWRVVFATIAALSVLALVGALAALPETLPQDRRSSNSPAHQARDILGIIANRPYLGHTLTVSFASMVLFAYISASPFVFQGILGLSPFSYSLAFGGNAIGLSLVSTVSARLVATMGPNRLVRLGLITMAVGVAATLALVLAHMGAPLLLPAIFLSIGSLGLILGNASALAIEQAARNAGTASALIGTLQFLFGAIAAPLVGIAGKESAVPMAVVMLVATALAAASFAFASRHQSRKA